MCGIAGIFQLNGQSVNRDRLIKMTRAIAHRGPDGEGIWTEGPIGFGHRRLAIVDLSPSGAQPMQNRDKTLTVTFNGEIYNYQDLRKKFEAEGVAFRSTSDTEILLVLYEKYGERMLEHLHGMFAFAVWDEQNKKLFFARDRVGKKPFYYSTDEHVFLFGSEIKALLEASTSKPKIDWSAIRVFLGLQYVPAPRTGFEGMFSLPPAHCGTVKNGEVFIRSYDVFPRSPVFSGTFSEAGEEIRRLMEESVRLRLMADVPVGAFLSGGVDSSIVATLMARANREPIKTFTMGFPSFGFDEREQARQLAHRLGSEHHEFEARPEAAAETVDALVQLYDGPYADSSALPTWLLARETRTQVKAVMTGDGGDELFAGYRRYGYFFSAMQVARLGFVSGAIAKGLEEASKYFQDPRALRFARTVRALRHSTGRGYATLFSGSYFSAEDEPWLLEPSFESQTATSSSRSFIESRFDSTLGWRGSLGFDFASYLPDDLNVKMDRASMAHGLEARSPFLDQDLVRFAVRLPQSFLARRGQIKPLLHESFRSIVSEEIFQRPKRGFQVPLADWFRGPLRPIFVERCLADQSALHRVCRPEAIRSYLEANDRGVDHGNRLWMLLVLATWLCKYSS